MLIHQKRSMRQVLKDLVGFWGGGLVEGFSRFLGEMFDLIVFFRENVAGFSWFLGEMFKDLIVILEEMLMS